MIAVTMQGKQVRGSLNIIFCGLIRTLVSLKWKCLDFKEKERLATETAFSQSLALLLENDKVNILH
jgi:hypothetical protein